MDLKSGIPFWLVKNGLLNEYPSLDENLDCEVVVLGGGISGALTAYYLTEAGINCIVVDGRAIGCGSTCASTSLLQYEIDTPLFQLQNQIGIAQANRAYQLCGRAIKELSKIAKQIGFKDFRYRKSLYFAHSEKDVPFLTNEFEARKKNHFDVEFLNQSEIKEMFGFSSPAGILSGLAAQTDAYAFTHALHQYNLKKGCKVFDRSPIVKIKNSKQNIILTSENNHTITAEQIVYATGYEAVNYIKKKIITLQSTYAIISENGGPQFKSWSHDVLLWNTANPYLYMRVVNGNRIIVGGRDEPFYNPQKRDRLLESKSQKLEKDFKKLFPNIPFKLEYKWTGTFGSTKDGLPYIGAYKPMPRSFFSLGFGGNGITFSQIAGEINRDLILGINNENACLFRFDR